MKKIEFKLAIKGAFNTYIATVDYFDGFKDVDFGMNEYKLHIKNNRGVFEINNGMDGRGNNIMHKINFLHVNTN